MSFSDLSAGWRPFIGWVCGFALLYSTVLEHLLRFIAIVGYGYLGQFPVLNENLLENVLYALLGLGAMRSYDKVKGVV